MSRSTNSVAARPRQASPHSSANPTVRLCVAATRIRVHMARCGIRSVSALARKLNDVGVEISDSQLGRVLDNKSEHLSLPLFGGLMQILECQVADLLEPETVAS